MTVPDVAAALAIAKALDQRRRYHAISFYEPYPKQREFLDLGATKRERLLMAGNQLGKTHTGAYEAAVHLTGEYPPWWKGRTWDRPTKGWIAGQTSLLVRDVQQKKLCGEPGVKESFGTGMVPRDALVDTSLARGVTDAFDTIQVRHKSGGVSVGRFKSYEQGREKFQGETLDWGWGDEEMDEDIYAEFLTRTAATGGMLWLTFTPLKGMSGVVRRFLDEPSPDRAWVGMTDEDALHISADQRAVNAAGYLPHEREARTKGTPMLGSGRIYSALESVVTERSLDKVPLHWKKLWGIDFGIDHPFGAALIAWDVDSDIIHVLDAFRMKDALPIQHVARMRPAGANVRIAWPQDGTQRDKGTLEPIAKQYKDQGMTILAEHAQWPDGGNSTEAGILEIQEREATGRIFYCETLTDLLEERRYYHRKKGFIVKEKDDILSAVRVAVMAKHNARPGPLGAMQSRRQRSTQAVGLDASVFT